MLKDVKPTKIRRFSFYNVTAIDKNFLFYFPYILYF